MNETKKIIDLWVKKLKKIRHIVQKKALGGIRTDDRCIKSTTL